jgi:hypothetical protein
MKDTTEDGRETEREEDRQRRNIKVTISKVTDINLDRF